VKPITQSFRHDSGVVGVVTREIYYRLNRIFTEYDSSLQYGLVNCVLNGLVQLCNDTISEREELGEDGDGDAGRSVDVLGVVSL